MKYPSSGLQELELARIESNCKTAKKFPPEKKITIYLGVDSLIRRTIKIKKKSYNLKYPRMLEWNCEEYSKRRMKLMKKKKLSNLIKGESVKRAVRC